jgi:hypothetical protein
MKAYLHADIGVLWDGLTVLEVAPAELEELDE